MSVTLRSPAALHDWLTASGFHPVRRGAAYRQNDLSVAFDLGWITVRGKALATSDLLRDQLGSPGLWKPVVDGKSQRARREFHLPRSVIEGGELWADGPEEVGDPIQACLQWAAETAGGDVPRDWKSPPRALVESWVPSRGLVLQRGPLLRQGELAYGPSRLGLSFPVVNEVPECLAPARREWLARVLADAQNRWRMVRVGFDSDTKRPAVRAEVDLSGAPHGMLEGLVKAGLDALRCVVCWLIWSCAFLCDARVTCRLWEAPQSGCSPQEGG
jgi:hypothetical protein